MNIPSPIFVFFFFLIEFWLVLSLPADMSSEGLGNDQGVSPSKDNDAENIQEHMLEDIFQQAIEVCILSFVLISLDCLEVQ